MQWHAAWHWYELCPGREQYRIWYMADIFVLCYAQDGGKPEKRDADNV